VHFIPLGPQHLNNHSATAGHFQTLPTIAENMCVFRFRTVITTKNRVREKFDDDGFQTNAFIYFMFRNLHAN